MTKIESTSVKAYAWSLTVWLTIYSKKSWAETIEQALASHPKWSVHGQEEVGNESGKPHYQLFLKTPDQPRKSKLIKIFPGVHIESETNRKALEKYVHKEETRVGEFKTIERAHITFPECIRQFIGWLDRQSLLDEAFTNDERLRIWDEFIEASVSEGIAIDIIGVNPQYRSCISKYWKGYIQNYIRQDKDKDKTQENNVAVVNIPVINAEDSQELSNEEEDIQSEETSSTLQESDFTCSYDSDSESSQSEY